MFLPFLSYFTTTTYGPGGPPVEDIFPTITFQRIYFDKGFVPPEIIHKKGEMSVQRNGIPFRTEAVESVTDIRVISASAQTKIREKDPSTQETNSTKNASRKKRDTNTTNSTTPKSPLKRDHPCYGFEECLAYHPEYAVEWFVRSSEGKESTGQLTGNNGVKNLWGRRVFVGQKPKQVETKPTPTSSNTQGTSSTTDAELKQECFVPDDLQTSSQNGQTNKRLLVQQTNCAGFFKRGNDGFKGYMKLSNPDELSAGYIGTGAGSQTRSKGNTTAQSVYYGRGLNLGQNIVGPWNQVSGTPQPDVLTLLRLYHGMFPKTVSSIPTVGDVLDFYCEWGDDQVLPWAFELKNSDPRYKRCGETPGEMKTRGRQPKRNASQSSTRSSTSSETGSEWGTVGEVLLRIKPSVTPSDDFGRMLGGMCWGWGVKNGTITKKIKQRTGGSTTNGVKDAKNANLTSKATSTGSETTNSSTNNKNTKEPWWCDSKHMTNLFLRPANQNPASQDGSSSQSTARTQTAPDYQAAVWGVCDEYVLESKNRTTSQRKQLVKWGNKDPEKLTRVWRGQCKGMMCSRLAMFVEGFNKWMGIDFSDTSWFSKLKVTDFWGRKDGLDKYIDFGYEVGYFKLETKTTNSAQSSSGSTATVVDATYKAGTEPVVCQFVSGSSGGIGGHLLWKQFVFNQCSGGEGAWKLSIDSRAVSENSSIKAMTGWASVLNEIKWGGSGDNAKKNFGDSDDVSGWDCLMKYWGDDVWPSGDHPDCTSTTSASAK